MSRSPDTAGTRGRVGSFADESDEEALLARSTSLKETVVAGTN